MKAVAQFVFWFVVALIALFLAIVLGERGAWYLAWVLGTVMIILIAVAGTVMLDVRYEDEPRE
ncbi:hypothetical protein V5738_01620 [Salinisphaera sp. SPP-AMP-43]|uniref:hypothetical protein n=1 Tax=Salinisphaera sp. SPP-AMP-43 TaxID=3121288 RepID=UPI003C6E26AE